MNPGLVISDSTEATEEVLERRAGRYVKTDSLSSLSLVTNEPRSEDHRAITGRHDGLTISHRSQARNLKARRAALNRNGSELNRK